MPKARTIIAVVPTLLLSLPLVAEENSVNQGKGTFTLFLPLSHKRLPRVSFYSVEDGNGFGGNYFGTGNSVLKR